MCFMKKSWQTLIACIGVLALTGAAWAAGDEFNAPEIQAKGGWVNWLIAVVFFFTLYGVAFKNSKRTHLD
jgi:hypothetical protein